jgi:hypothetical protein
MSTTAGDWGVTATQQIERCVERFAAARTAELTPAGVLAACYGVELAELARELGLAGPDQAEAALAPLRAAASERLRERLPAQRDT